MQVRPPARQRGLRIQHCHSCSLGHDCSRDPIPGPGAPHATGQPNKERKKGKEERPEGQEEKQGDAVAWMEQVDLAPAWSVGPLNKLLYQGRESRAGSPRKQERETPTGCAPVCVRHHNRDFERIIILNSHQHPSKEGAILICIQNILCKTK